MSERAIIVTADWDPFPTPIQVGTLYADILRGREVYSFVFTEEWLEQWALLYSLGDDLQVFSGRQYPSIPTIPFPTLFDSTPDRWGRTLIKRREAIEARRLGHRQPPLFESDYLLNVHDVSRMGALRFSLDPKGPFLYPDTPLATPPWVRLRELEQSALLLEQHAGHEEEAKWIKQLLAPGSSLGGARPKATVIDESGSLWIAKFPSAQDIHDWGAWEMVAHDLAASAAIDVPSVKIERLSDNGSTYLSKRFDRSSKGRRLHFTSALALVHGKAGEGSYLDIAQFIKTNSSQPQQDLSQLFRRILFNIAISNTDDHLCNHGFILTSKGWKLSPAYDLNPDPYRYALSLTIDEADSSLDFSLALEQGPRYDLSSHQAAQILEEVRQSVSRWKQVAQSYDLSRSEIALMENAFNI